MNTEKDLVKIILQFSDGSERAIDKGFVCSMAPVDDGDVEFTFNMCDISGAELQAIVVGVMQFGAKIGMFDNLPDE